MPDSHPDYTLPPHHPPPFITLEDDQPPRLDLRSLTKVCASSDTWPSLLGLVNVGVPEQYLWSLFTLVSAAVQNTWGPYNPTTWGEALVWTIGMVLVAVLFAVIVGFITAAIRSSIQTKAKYKDMMDTVVVSYDPS